MTISIICCVLFYMNCLLYDAINVIVYCILLVPVHHIDPLQVDEGFADLQAEQHQSYNRERLLVLN